MELYLYNTLIINENTSFKGSILIKDGIIEKIFTKDDYDLVANKESIDLGGKILLPGIIDDQVHFREPGLTQKGDIYTEAKAAVAGGITSFMEMPNTNPPTITLEALEAKYKLGSEKSLANFSFYMGATNDNMAELRKLDKKQVCGIKVFMGSSTGNMLVDNDVALNKIFRDSDILIATHCEDEQTIKTNLSKHIDIYGADIPVELHPVIRSSEACYKSSAYAVNLAKRHNSRLHILHLSTAKELDLFDANTNRKEKRITAEVCVHHLWFNDLAYHEKGTLVKWNPAIKTPRDQQALLDGVLANKLDVIATDHAPHTLPEKQNVYTQAPSGGPLVQHSLVAMLEMHRRGKITLEQIVDKMCHAPADIFQISKRGYIREGHWADLVVIDLNNRWRVEKENILYKCGWSPFEGQEFTSRVLKTFVNGHLVYDEGKFDESHKGMRLTFER